MARLYAVCSLRRDSRDPPPIPPRRGPLAEQHIDGGALVPPCASHGDSARHTALTKEPTPGTRRCRHRRNSLQAQPWIEQCRIESSARISNTALGQDTEYMGGAARDIPTRASAPATL